MDTPAPTTTPTVAAAQRKLDAIAGRKGTEAIDRGCDRCTAGLVTFTSYAGRVCFKCNGAGTLRTTVTKERARLRGIIRREAAREEAANARAAGRIEQVDEVRRLAREVYDYTGPVYPAPATYNGDTPAAEAWTAWLNFCRGTVGVCPSTAPRAMMMLLEQAA